LVLATQKLGGITGWGTRRAGAFALLAILLGAYYAFVAHLTDLSTRWELTFLALCLMPAVFGLVWFALPYRRHGRLFVVATVFLALAVIFEVADLGALANFAKLGLMTSLGFWFLTYFESVLWVALVALVIPIVDSVSVWRGPTRHIVEEQPQIFDVFSFAFPSPGGETSANLGLPDLLFFALFLAAAVRWNLRAGWTWVALTLSLGATMLLAVEWGVAGLPALPGLAFAFLIPNTDLLWREFQRWRREPHPSSER
jgi:Na+/H+-dicarboxylate symporter